MCKKKFINIWIAVLFYCTVSFFIEDLALFNCRPFNLSIMWFKSCFAFDGGCSLSSAYSTPFSGTFFSISLSAYSTPSSGTFFSISFDSETVWVATFLFPSCLRQEYVLVGVRNSLFSLSSEQSTPVSSSGTLPSTVYIRNTFLLLATALL